MISAEQKKALKALQAAFKLCSKEGISFYGIDSELCWTIEKDLGDVQDWFNDSCSEEKSGTVITHRTYRDSCGM